MRTTRRALVIATLLLLAGAGVIPDPPLVVVLPDLTEHAADRVEYDVDARVVHVFRDRLFVDDFEE
jgi:hypothetical protein